MRRLPNTVKFSFGESTALIGNPEAGLDLDGSGENLVALRLRLPAQDIRRVHPTNTR